MDFSYRGKRGDNDTMSASSGAAGPDMILDMSRWADMFVLVFVSHKDRSRFLSIAATLFLGIFM